MLTPKTKRNLKRLIPFVVIWMVFSIIYSFIEKGILGPLDVYPSTGNPYNFGINFFSTLLVSTLTGIGIGVLEIFYIDKKLSKKSFVEKLVYKTFLYLACLIVFLLLVTMMSNAISSQTNIFNTQNLLSIWAFISNFAFWSIIIYVAVLLVITLFYNEAIQSLGYGVVQNFFIGKYHTPIVEERIFMFLDMKSSTTIAEELGHVKYFELLKEYYSDLSHAIINYSGEIYQYVGDEIVVSWELKKGLKNNNCLLCFFEMKSYLLQQSDKYTAQFGVVPSFKAGFHLGDVTTGEIGVIKKDIIFTGDVLNTTARIQSLCNSYQVDVLISGHMLQRMTLDTDFQVAELGIQELRGRDETVELFTVMHTQNTNGVS